MMKYENRQNRQSRKGAFIRPAQRFIAAKIPEKDCPAGD